MYIPFFPTIKRFLAAAALLALIVISQFGTAFAQVVCDSTDTSSDANAAYQVCVNDLPQVQANDDRLNAVLTIAFALIGVMCLLAIVIAGFRYVISQGDPQATAKAKSAIIFALVGLIVSISAAAIVNFVIGKI